MIQGKNHNNNYKQFPAHKEENLVTQLLAKYISYWPAFALFLILFISAAYIYLRYTTPLYEATATLIIKDEKKGYDNSELMDQLNKIRTNKIIENEVEVLQSRSLMDNVVNSLYLYAPVSVEGQVKAVSAYVISPLDIQISDPDSIKEVQKVHFEYDKANNTVSIDGKPAGPVNEWLQTSYGRLKFTRNNKYIEAESPSKKFYFSLFQTKNVTKQMLPGLKVVAASKLSSVINLSYRDAVPQRAEDVLNQLIIAYNRAAIDEKNSLSKNTLDFVEDRLALVKRDLDSVERKVQRYKSTNNATDISSQGQQYLSIVGANDQRITEYNAQLSAMSQVENALTSGNNNGNLMSAAVGINDQTLTQMIGQLNNAELEYERLKKTVAENNPILVSLRDQMTKLRPSILSNVQTQRKSLEASRNNFSQKNNSLNSMLSAIPQKERQLVEMSRDQNITNGLYSFLLQKREESKLSFASTLSDSRVVNKAQASKFPVSPNKMLIYLAAVALGFGVCIVFISAREALSRKILYRHDLESLTNIPILGEVAYNDSKDELVIQAGKRSFIAEEFRKIRVSLHFLGLNAERKKILVTSSIPGEGKSFIAANLAISNSLSGKKVVLVDIDLHNPGLSKIFDRSTADAGMSDYLTGEKDAEDIIKRVPNFENLFFVSSGTLHESPSELLLNGKIKDFLAYLGGIFDLVVLDTAPVVLVTDAFILSGYSDATLYVVRHKYTPKMLVKRIDENNRINPLANPGIIFNGVKTRGFFKNNYGYGYDYVYGDKQRNKDKRQKRALAKL